jgi:hypothetical protein
LDNLYFARFGNQCSGIAKLGCHSAGFGDQPSDSLSVLMPLGLGLREIQKEEINDLAIST